MWLCAWHIDIPWIGTSPLHVNWERCLSSTAWALSSGTCLMWLSLVTAPVLWTATARKVLIVLGVDPKGLSVSCSSPSGAAKVALLSWMPASDGDMDYSASLVWGCESMSQEVWKIPSSIYRVQGKPNFPERYIKINQSVSTMNEEKYVHAG